ncbi:hypothetical protein ACFYOF_17115 [Streptomyces sp. NPDC007148]|uniref:hypothetical protein n=1 Tax=Streptomyces sp. NPDC007148 TaxID=3364775 RepID=UPI00368B9A85
MAPQTSFPAWLTAEVSRCGYDFYAYGEQSRFARDVGLADSIVSRLVRGTSTPDVRSCVPIAKVLGCRTVDVLAAAGLIPAEEIDAPPRPLTQHEHLVGLVGEDPGAQDAVIVLLRALGKWTS